MYIIYFYQGQADASMFVIFVFVHMILLCRNINNVVTKSQHYYKVNWYIFNQYFLKGIKKGVCVCVRLVIATTHTFSIHIYCSFKNCILLLQAMGKEFKRFVRRPVKSVELPLNSPRVKSPASTGFLAYLSIHQIL